MAFQMGNWGEVTPRNEVITLLSIGTGPPCRCFFFHFWCSQSTISRGRDDAMYAQGCMFFVPSSLRSEQHLLPCLVGWIYIELITSVFLGLETTKPSCRKFMGLWYIYIYIHIWWVLECPFWYEPVGLEFLHTEVLRPSPLMLPLADCPGQSLGLILVTR